MSGPRLGTLSNNRCSGGNEYIAALLQSSGKGILVFQPFYTIKRIDYGQED
jgi:hypothetical protein